MQDERFNTAEAVMANWVEGSVEVTRAIASQPLSYWVERFATLRGQWAPYQGLLDIAKDPQVLANDIIIEVEATNGGDPIKLIAAPVQFNKESSPVGRSPEASEHTELVLMELGIDWDRIEALKAKGAVA
jgi:crotonobetainyl-CoA:carnitine CoA-transferase CaiB-like acyl-CoA transferase